MTVFSLVAIPICVFLLAVRHQKQLLQWLSQKLGWKKCSEEASNPSDVQRMAPYPAQPIKGRERYRVMMDIRKLDAQNWLTLDKNYMDEHRVRTQLLHEKRENVLRCLPESMEPCQEALEEVSDFLCERFPNMFTMSMQDKKKNITNQMTRDTFTVSGRDSNEGLTEALEAAVRLTMEDLSILMMNEEGEYYLAASASLFPTGWTVNQRIGWTISQLHGPVPLWHQQVANSVSKFLARLTPTSPMERSNYFVEIKAPNENLTEILYRPGALCEKELTNPLPSEILIRRERQTFRRLPRTGAIVFGVKTYLTPLDELPMTEFDNLAKEMSTWPDYVGEYKGKDVWGAKVLEYYQTRVREERGETEKKQDLKIEV
ncbi:hypothetical protein N7457_005198 [Penicillium paradoxum]|uniref:uncharacterized protein n=1 Tax=Penicillium paradoxum TaxID=176176 RepID=UPI002547CB61|nr:uncharacterized protein N7457_005198 [Penicillium paradoxum]KAJ5780038.1 hypothetical protein N7457_005198 [Penicillium paradoxum]